MVLSQTVVSFVETTILLFVSEIVVSIPETMVYTVNSIETPIG